MRAQVLILFIIFFSSLSYANDEETQVKLYRPFGQAIAQAPLKVTETYSGECAQQSIRIKREDAWRCQAGNRVYDPCFINPFSAHKQALCPASPWNGTSILLNLTTPANHNGFSLLDVSKTYPWAIELKTGEKCEALEKEGIYDNMPILYRCNNQTELLGHLQRCRTTWTILQRHPGNHISTAVVMRAWF